MRYLLKPFVKPRGGVARTMNISDSKNYQPDQASHSFYEEKGLVTADAAKTGYRTYTQQHLNELTPAPGGRWALTLEERRAGGICLTAWQLAPTSTAHAGEGGGDRTTLGEKRDPCATSCWRWRILPHSDNDSASCPIYRKSLGCCHRGPEWRRTARM